MKVAEKLQVSIENHIHSEPLGNLPTPQNQHILYLKPKVEISSLGIPSCVECGTTENLHTHHISYEPPITEIRCQKCHSKLHNQEPNLSLAKTHYEILKDLEKLRIATENRIRSLKGFDIDTTFLKEELKTIKSLEKKANQEMIKAVEKNNIFPWLVKVDGVADKSAAMLIALIGDVDRFPTVSSLWAYAGLAVENGEAPRRKKGNQIHYNPHLKMLCLGIIGGNFIRSKAEPQYQNYLNKKSFYEQNRDWKKLRRHRAAIRFVVKEFMKQLWLEWRKLENLPLTHTHPQDNSIGSVKPRLALGNLVGEKIGKPVAQVEAMSVVGGLRQGRNQSGRRAPHGHQREIVGGKAGLEPKRKAEQEAGSEESKTCRPLSQNAETCAGLSRASLQILAQINHYSFLSARSWRIWIKNGCGKYNSVGYFDSLDEAVNNFIRVFRERFSQKGSSSPDPSAKNGQPRAGYNIEIRAGDDGGNIEAQTKLECWREARRRYRKLHPEKIKEYNKKYQKTHKEQIKQHYLQNKEKHKERKRKWKLENRKLQALYMRKWRLLHPEKNKLSIKKQTENHKKYQRTWMKTYRKAHPEKVSEWRSTHYSKGFELLIENHWQCPVEYHHLSPTHPFVIPIPANVHRAVYGKFHHVFNAGIVCQLYGIDLKNKGDKNGRFE